MSHDLSANNPGLQSFHMALGIWTHLLEQCGSYFPCIMHGARYYTLFDDRMMTHFHDINDDGIIEKFIRNGEPAILCNCGFEITEEEAKVLARIARNYAALQRSLDTLPAGEMPDYPQKIRQDLVELYERFAIWAEQSQGFRVH